MLAPDQARAALDVLPPSLQTWLHAEQTRRTPAVNPRLLNAGGVDQVPPQWLPQAAHVWRLPTRWVPRDMVDVWRAPGVALPFNPMRRGRVLVLLHPLADFRAAWLADAVEGPAWWATATASTRTVLVWSPRQDTIPFFAKLSIPRVIAAEHRGLDASQVASSVGKTQLLQAWSQRRALQFLGEPWGVSIRDGTPAGYLVRTVPPRVLAGRRHLVPWFSFARRSLVQPLVHALVEAAVTLGAVGEAHAQNLLVELDASRHPTGRFVMRDLEGVSFDLGHLERCGARALVKTLPVVTHREDDYDTLDHARAAQQSLHTFLLGGPLHALNLSSTFLHRVLRTAMRRLDPGCAVVPGAEGYARWLEDVRWRRQMHPRVPPPLRAWLHREQHVNDRVRHPTLFARMDLGGLPLHHDPKRAPVFELESLLVPLEDVELIPARLPASWRALFLVQRGEQTLVRFPIHPAATGQYVLDIAQHGLERGVLVGTPTASPRSLVVWRKDGKGQPFGLKLSLDVEIQHITRLLRRGKLQRAVAVTHALDALRLDGVKLMREPVTLRLKHQDHGTIVREIPDDTRRLVPGFSMFAVEQSPLLRGDPARLFHRVVRHVFAPLVSAAAQLLFGQGLLPDLHQQNVLFGPRGTLWIRDLDSFKTDVDVRVRRGLSMASWLQSPGSCEDLKLTETARWYDDAYGKQLRAEWVFLAQRLLGTHHTERLYRVMDGLLLRHAAHHLGLDVVVEELRHVTRHRRQLLPPVDDVNALVALWQRLPRSAVLDGQQPTSAVFSVNAMVHGWRRRHPLKPSGPHVSQAAFQALARQGRTTAAPSPAHTAYTRRNGIVVAWNRAGDAVAYGLPLPGATC